VRLVPLACRLGRNSLDRACQDRSQSSRGPCMNHRFLPLRGHGLYADSSHGVDLQVLRREARMFSNSTHSGGTQFFGVVPCPCVIRPAIALQANMGTRPLLRFWIPADAQKGTIHAGWFTTRPRAHTKRIDLGGLRIRSILSARTRNARAVTFTSASCLVFPYAITPGKSGTSANHRPSASCSNSIRNDSESGGCGRVAIKHTPAR